MPYRILLRPSRGKRKSENAGVYLIGELFNVFNLEFMIRGDHQIGILFYYDGSEVHHGGKLLKLICAFLL